MRVRCVQKAYKAYKAYITNKANEENMEKKEKKAARRLRRIKSILGKESMCLRCYLLPPISNLRSTLNVLCFMFYFLCSISYKL